MDQLKQQRTNNYQQLARQDLLRSKVVTLDTSHLLMSPLNAAALLKAVVLGRRKKKSKKWNVPNKQQRNQNYQQLARQDLLEAMVVTLDTTQLLRSALNEEAP